MKRHSRASGNPVKKKTLEARFREHDKKGMSFLLKEEFRNQYVGTRHHGQYKMGMEIIYSFISMTRKKVMIISPSLPTLNSSQKNAKKA